MASFTYGIDCEDPRKARKLWQFIAALNMAQDGLDLAEERVSVTAGQALLAELKTYAARNPGDLHVQAWPADLEYDDAEREGRLETHPLQGKASRAAKAVGPVGYKTYAGSQANLQAFRDWLTGQSPAGLAIVSQWEPQVEGGSWGVEFRCEVAAFNKTANAHWIAQGVVTEKLRR